MSLKTVRANRPKGPALAKPTLEIDTKVKAVQQQHHQHQQGAVFGALPTKSGKMLKAHRSMQMGGTGYETYLYEPNEPVFYQTCNDQWRLGRIVFPLFTRSDGWHQWLIEVAPEDKALAHYTQKNGHEWRMMSLAGGALIPARCVSPNVA